MGGHDKDDDLKKSPFYGLTKSVVLQECRAFNDSDTVTQKPDLCCILISKVLYLVVVEGETLSSSEVTDVFFGATKLFQSQDVTITIEYSYEVAEKTSAEEVIIVVSTLLKDLNSDNELFRANSLRVLSRILDVLLLASMLAQVERYIKQAIVHKNPCVASSALLCGLYLFTIAPELVRRWVNEINQSLTYEDEMVQYHGLLLLYAMKQNDALALNKLVTQLRQHLPTSPLAVCMLIRYSVRLLREDGSSEVSHDIYDLLLRCLRHTSDMVCFEAARALVTLPDVRDEDLQPVVSMLQIHLGSSRTVTKFAAVRILNQLSIAHPTIVETCNSDLESLVNDSNRSVATLAVSTLLKTVEVSRIDPLLKQISTYMSEIDDEFKQVLVHALLTLSTKFPEKYDALLSFLSGILRNEGSEALKAAIVDTIIAMMKRIPESLEPSLLHLCECIEDCEYPQIIIGILHVLAEYGPTAVAPSRFIRFIFNRIILEGASVRAAAVQSLGEFAGRVESVRESVQELLRGCLTDESDEVRDRAVTALAALQADPAEREKLLFRHLPMSAKQLRASLQTYQMRPSEGSLEYSTLPVVAEVPRKKEEASVQGMATETESETTAEPSSNELYQIPAFAEYGCVIRSSHRTMLTEEETEYVVSVIRHVFASHVVLQFQIKNTIEGQVMTNVTVQLSLTEGDPEQWHPIAQIDAPVILYGQEKACYIALEFNPEEIPEATFDVTLKFEAKDAEEDELDELDTIEGYNEEYPVEACSIQLSDYISRPILPDYRAAWNELTAENEVVEKMSLSFEDLSTAVKSIVEVLGLHVFEGSDRVPIGSTNHTMILAGKVLGQTLVMARCQLILSQEYGCVLKVGILLFVQKIMS
ncbi:coatomer subunit [Blastocystis sp. subtype 4]|uniref:coatomer subunit n=1 Tax=Blastocystis sp. subtype 4 TaxID=944170 RepID=UPI0007119338|nr:coatomer subunit [Blastocystis sp. subtype 4]KNB46255.1 coatomer subunit [Blastocystis sp. subtype 4]|eukprot:XP_014529697.1 coatomer subunit [Blastocystis sp. subtype 4]